MLHGGGFFSFIRLLGQGSDCLFTYANSMPLPSMELLEFHILKLLDTDACLYVRVLHLNLILMDFEMDLIEMDFTEVSL